MEGLFKAIVIKHGTVTSPFSQKNNKKKVNKGLSSYG